jgi:polyisoprenyl-teichoic acid--peptidoglycan teichoic acid transferase
VSPASPSSQPKRPRSKRVRRRRRILLFSALALVVVILAAAGGTYLWFAHLVGSANGRVDPGVSAALTSSPPASLAVPASPGAMDILLLGSDKRAGVPGSRSDTIMLVHVDPAKNFVSLLSLPRDLRVDVPDHGEGKLNTAYAYGGAALAIRTVKELTGVNIDHYLQVDFQAFQDLADSLGGVYIDVDRRYFNDDLSYEPIDIQAGYQLLGGHDALEYVRFRHDSNSDFGRMLRQQRFLTALKEQVGAQGAGLLLKLPGMASDLFSNATTDLSAEQILRLAYFGARLGGGHIRQVRLVGDTPTIDGVSYVVASQADIEQAVKGYLTPLASGSSTTGGSTEDVASGTTGHHDLSAWTAVAATVPFALEAPDYLPADYAYVDRVPRAGKTYTIKTGGGSEPAVRIIYQYSDHDQYLGVTETTWLDAPVASPGLKVEHDGTTYTVVGTEGKVDRVWWKKGGVLFWVSNTLSYLLSENEMLGVAESSSPVGSSSSTTT